MVWDEQQSKFSLGVGPGGVKKAELQSSHFGRRVGDIQNWWGELSASDEQENHITN